jgi:hypothetical protein
MVWTMRERRPGKGAALGKEAVLADSGRAGEVSAGVGLVRKATVSTSCEHTCSPSAARFGSHERQAADSSRLSRNDRRLAFPRHLRFDDLVNEFLTIEESNAVRHEFLFLTIKRLDLRMF